MAREHTKPGWLLALVASTLLTACTLVSAAGHVAYNHLATIAAPMSSGIWQVDPLLGCVREGFPLLHDPSDALWWEWFCVDERTPVIVSQVYEPPLDQPPDYWGNRTRITTWGPHFFTSVAYGDWDHPVTIAPRGPRVHALQFYYGDGKVDGTLSFALRAGRLGGTPAQQKGVVMTYTAKELGAARPRDLAYNCEWSDQAGC